MIEKIWLREINSTINRCVVSPDGYGKWKATLDRPSAHTGEETPRHGGIHGHYIVGRQSPAYENRFSDGLATDVGDNRIVSRKTISYARADIKYAVFMRPGK